MQQNGRAAVAGEGPKSQTIAAHDANETTSFLQVCCAAACRWWCSPYNHVWCVRNLLPVLRRVDLACSKVQVASLPPQDIEAAAAAAQQDGAGRQVTANGGAGAARRGWRRCDLWWLVALPAAVMLLLAARVGPSRLHCCALRRLSIMPQPLHHCGRAFRRIATNELQMYIGQRT